MNTSVVILKIEVYRFRITPIVKRLMKANPIYGEKFEQDEIIEEIVGEMSELGPQKFMAITDHELIGRIKRRMALELVSGLLDDFTPAEMKIFDEAVNGR